MFGMNNGKSELCATLQTQRERYRRESNGALYRALGRIVGFDNDLMTERTDQEIVQFLNNEVSTTTDKAVKQALQAIQKKFPRHFPTASKQPALV